jgi:hypothetical protein
MKKLAAIITMGCLLACAVNVSADDNIRTKSMVGDRASTTNSMTRFGHQALYYIPNLLMDALDIVDMTIGLGSQFSAEVHLTYACQMGGWNGGDYFIGKGCNRQFGGGYLNGSIFGLLLASNANIIGEESYGTYKDFIMISPGFSPLSWNEDAFRDGDLDYFAIGGRVGWLFNVSFDIHLIEVADLVCGVVMYDFKEDDF